MIRKRYQKSLVDGTKPGPLWQAMSTHDNTPTPTPTSTHPQAPGTRTRRLMDMDGVFNGDPGWPEAGAAAEGGMRARQHGFH